MQPIHLSLRLRFCPNNVPFFSTALTNPTSIQCPGLSRVFRTREGTNTGVELRGGTCSGFRVLRGFNICASTDEIVDGDARERIHEAEERNTSQLPVLSKKKVNYSEGRLRLNYVDSTLGAGDHACAVEGFPTDENTRGETDLNDKPVEEESTGKVSAPVADQSTDPEKKKMVTRPGDVPSAGYFVLALGALLFVDCRLPIITPRALAPNFLTKPFLLSALVAAVAGYIFVPLLRRIKVSQIFRREGPAAHLVKSGTPTMGGLFFVPVGLAVASVINQSAAVELHGVIIVTLVYAGIGFLDDCLALLRKHNYGLPGRIKFMLQVVAGLLFFLWLKSANVSSSYLIKNIVPLPAPLGHLHLGIWYMALTAFCFTAMSNGVNLTDGLDGLAGGTVAAAFIGMAVAVLPSNPALGVFGSSMAGACFGFLVHNRYKATVFMGDTGSLALGGALAAMAACSGMFFPLFIVSGVFVVETISVMGQVFYFQLTKRLHGQGRRWLRMAPFHHHLEFLGFSETKITILAYAVGIVLSICGAYTGLLLS